MDKFNKDNKDNASDGSKKFSTLKQIVDQLKLSGDEKLVEDPAFKRLEAFAKHQKPEKDPLARTELNTIIEELEAGHLAYLGSVMERSVAFTALKEMAKTPPFIPHA